MILSLIAAHDENNIIGNDSKIPWSFKEDFKNFKKITSNRPIIMGRKTYESIGKPLPDRINIVLSSNERYNPHPDVLVVPTLNKALNLVALKEEVFIIGGEKVYRESLNIADKLYLTVISGKFDGNIKFPEITEKDWEYEKDTNIIDIDRFSGKEYVLRFLECKRIKSA